MAKNKFAFMKDSSKKIREDYPILDLKVMEFVVQEFPEEGENLKLELSNLRKAIENTIDAIEDKSSEVVKKSRDFETSAKYRENSIRLHEISESINQYVSWMNEISIKKSVEQQVEKVHNDIEYIEEVKEEEKYLVLTLDEDFTGKSILGFKLDDFEVEVTNWDDVVIYVAELLTKNYRECRGNKIEEQKPGNENLSPENKVRNSVWEIINEYGIEARKLKVYVK